METLVKDASDAISSPNLSPINKLYIQQLSVCSYLGLITGLRFGLVQKEYQTKIVFERNYGIGSLLFKHVQLEPSTHTLKLNFKTKTNITNQSYQIRHTVFFDIMFSLWSNLTGCNQRIFNLISPRGLNVYLDSIVPGLTSKAFRKYRANSLIYLNCKSINKIIIENEFDYTLRDIHHIFWTQIFEKASISMEHLSKDSLFYYIDPQLIVSIFNQNIDIKDLNLKKTILKRYIYYVYKKNKTVKLDPRFEKINLDLFDYNLILY